jgi:hypothetical protein
MAKREMADPNSPEEIRRKIDIQDRLIAKWMADADAITGTDKIARTSKKYYRNRARAAREQKEELEARLASLSA